MTHQYSGPPPRYAPAPYQPPAKKRTGLKITLGVVGGLLLMGGCFAAVSGGDNTSTTATTTREETTPTIKKAKEPRKQAPGIGDVVKDGKFAFKVTKLETRTKVGNEFLNKTAQGEFLLVRVTVKNIGDEAQSFFGTNQKLFDSKGRAYKADSEAALYLTDSKSLYEEINPGNAVKGVILFDVPDSAKAASIELHDSAFSGGVKVTLQ